MHAHRLIHICSSEKKMMIEKDEKKRAESEMFRLMVKKMDDWKSKFVWHLPVFRKVYIQLHKT